MLSADEEEADTDLETDRLLGQQRLDDHGFGDDKVRNTIVLSTNDISHPPHLSLSSCIFVHTQSWTERPKIRSVRSPSVNLISKNHTAIRAGVGTQLSAESPANNVGITNVYGNGGSVPLGTGTEEDVATQPLPASAEKSPAVKSVSVLCVYLL